MNLLYKSFKRLGKSAHGNTDSMTHLPEWRADAQAISC